MSTFEEDERHKAAKGSAMKEREREMTGPDYKRLTKVSKEEEAHYWCTLTD